MGFKFLYQNVRGLKSKTNQFRRNLQSNDCSSYDIICITETNFDSNIKSSDLFPEDYLVFRRDRQSSTLSKTSCGGGVLVAVKRGLTPNRKKEWESSAEDIWVTLHGSRNIHLCVVYLPPDDDWALSYYLSKFENIFNQNSDDVFMICGDFNMPKIEWTTYARINVLIPMLYQGKDGRSAKFIDTIFRCGLQQYNSSRNTNNKLLDLILSNNNTKLEVRKSEFFLAPEDLHHPPLQFSLSL